jgi:protoheme IX farnesyltransferase
MTMSTTFQEYYRLAKPGIVYGNILTALAAFIFASEQHPNFVLMVAALFGLAACIASACVVNNVLDRDIDLRMERTKKRAIPTGRISLRSALIFAAVLFAAGCGVLFFFTNLLALAITIFGVLIYVCLYTPLKRRSVHSTIVGALAGAVPPVVGYVAVSNTLDTTTLLSAPHTALLSALALFLILVCWQMPHFFAIAIFRLKDYTEAALPVMPVQIGIPRTKILMLVYVLLFALATFTLYLVAQLGVLYVVTMAILSGGWTSLALSGFFTKNTTRWSRAMFFYSLIVILAFSLVLALS